MQRLCGSACGGHGRRLLMSTERRPKNQIMPRRAVVPLPLPLPLPLLGLPRSIAKPRTTHGPEPGIGCLHHFVAKCVVTTPTALTRSTDAGSTGRRLWAMQPRLPR
jgi:hypothetical protein